VRFNTRGPKNRLVLDTKITANTSPAPDRPFRLTISPFPERDWAAAWSVSCGKWASNSAHRLSVITFAPLVDVALGMVSDMDKKRFTYWTADGKRHWTPFIGIAVPASELPLPAERLLFCRSRSSLSQARQRQDTPPGSRERAIPPECAAYGTEDI